MSSAREKQEDRGYLELVDASGGDFYKPELAGFKVAVVTVVDRTGAPGHKQEDTALFDPRCLRFHDLLRKRGDGADERWMAVQTVNTFDADYDTAEEGHAPYQQPEFFTAINRSTRESDVSGRSAIPGSHRRIIDSEDGLYALALTLNEVPLHQPGAVGGDEEAEETKIPEGVTFSEAGTTADTGGSVTRYQASVSFGGLTIFGDAAVEAAKKVFREGGSVEQARTAAKKAAGLPVSAAEEAAANATGPTRERGSTGQGGELTESIPPEDEDGVVTVSDVPAGYVSARSGKTGMLGTFWTPEHGAGLFTGREGHEIGILPMRHDAQVAVTDELIGRFHIKTDDVTAIPERRSGKLIKGWLLPDKSVANEDSALGHETMQLRPCIRIAAEDIPSRQPPPPWPPDPPPEVEEDLEEPDDEEEGKPPRPETGSPPPKRPQTGGPGAGSGTEPGGLTTGKPGVLPDPWDPKPPPPRRPQTGGGSSGGTGTTGGGAGTTGGPLLPPVSNPESQARNFQPGAGTPCPNATGGGVVVTPGGKGGGLKPVGTTGGTSGTTGSGLLYPGGGGVFVRPGTGGVTMTPAGPIVHSRGHPAVMQDPETGALLLGGRQDVAASPGGAAGAQQLNARVNLQAGLDPSGSPFLDHNGDPISPADFDPENDPRVPLDELPPIDDLPSGRQAIARAKRESRAKREEREAKANQTRDEKLEQRQQEREQATKDKFDRIQKKLEELREAAQKRGDRQESERLAREMQKNQRRREKQEKRDQKQRERNERTKKKREEDKRRREERRKREKERREKNKKRKKSRQGVKGKPFIVETDPGGFFGSSGFGVKEAGQGVTAGAIGDAKSAANPNAPQEDPKFGEWNTANMPTPLFGAVGGPTTVGGALQLYGAQLGATRNVVNAAFAGPGYLSANLAVIHEDPRAPVGSTIGTRYNTLGPGHTLVVDGRLGATPLTVYSGLEATNGGAVVATGGGLLQVVRETGAGLVMDSRPAVFVQTHGWLDEAADAFVYHDDRRAYVSGQGVVGGRGVHAIYKPGELAAPLPGGDVLVAGASATAGYLNAPVTKYLNVPAASGITNVSKGVFFHPSPSDLVSGFHAYTTEAAIAGSPTIPAGSLVLQHYNTSGVAGAKLALTDDGAIFAFSPTGTCELSVENGDLAVTDDIFCDKLTCNSIDPRSLIMDQVAAKPSELTASLVGLWALTTDNRAYWWDKTASRKLLQDNDLGVSVQAYDAGLADIAGIDPTKGKLLVGNGTNWVALAVGTDGQVLTADSSQAAGVKWA